MMSPNPFAHDDSYQSNYQSFDSELNCSAPWVFDTFPPKDSRGSQMMLPDPFTIDPSGRPESQTDGQELPYPIASSDPATFNTPSQVSRQETQNTFDNTPTARRRRHPDPISGSLYQNVSRLFITYFLRMIIFDMSRSLQIDSD